MMKRLSIRWKLTLWYSGVLAVVLVAFGTAIYFIMSHHLLQRMDQGLAEELSDVLYEVKRSDDPKGLHGWLVRRFSRHEGFDFQITTMDGDRFFANPRLEGKTLPVPDTDLTNPVYESVRSAELGHWRMVTVKVVGPDGPLTVQVARSLESYDHELAELLLVLLMTGPLTLIVAISGGYFLARRALAPVDKMSTAANEVTAHRLDQRLEVANPDDELGRLAGTLNDMIARLERSFIEMKQFTADAAHELRTPLTVIHNEAEVALRSPRSADEYCHVLENVLEETDRLTHMADQLLFLSRQDTGLHSKVREPVHISNLVQEAVDHMRVVAQEKEVNLTLEKNPPCAVVGDYHQLRRVLFNLLDNAIKYTPASGSVVVSSENVDGSVTISIKDSGVGIAPEHLPNIFKRFYRADPSRSADGQGIGLGLALCRSIVEDHAGTINVESIVGEGTTVMFRLPWHCENDQSPKTP